MFVCLFFSRCATGVWDLSSPTRDRTWALSSGSVVLTTGLPGKNPCYQIYRTFSFYILSKLYRGLKFPENSVYVLCIFAWTLN